MADKAAKPESPGDKVDSAKDVDSPDQATAAGQAKSRNSAGQPETATSRDDVQPKFREALERKRAKEAGTISICRRSRARCEPAGRNWLCPADR